MRRFAGAVFATCLVLVSAGCGDDEGSDAEDTAATEPTAAEPTASAGSETAESEPTATAGSDTGGTEGSASAPPSGEPITDYVAYVGGTAGPADSSLEPYKIGYVNTEGGSVVPLSLEATPATEWAVQYINDKLGGIDGHPLELVECFVKNAEEEGLDCAQQFLNDPGISLIAYGALTTGADTLNGTIDGQKVVIAGYSPAQSNLTAKNLYAPYPIGNFAMYSWGQFGREVLNAKTNAIIYPDAPGWSDTAQAVKVASEAAGITPTLVGFDPAGTDILAALTAANAQDADMVSPLVATDNCLAVVAAMDQLGIDPNIAVGFTTCVDPSLKDQYPGGDLPTWYVGQAQAGAGFIATPEGDAWRAALGEYDHSDKERQDWWSGMFGQTLTIAQLLNAAADSAGGVENITPDAIAEHAKALTGPIALGAPYVQCGKYPEMPAVCSDGAYFFHYEGDGVFTRDNPWMATPQELQEELGAVPST